MDKREKPKFSINIKDIIDLQNKGIEIQLFIDGKYYNFVDTSNETKNK